MNVTIMYSTYSINKYVIYRGPVFACLKDEDPVIWIVNMIQLYARLQSKFPENITPCDGKKSQ